MRSVLCSPSTRGRPSRGLALAETQLAFTIPSLGSLNSPTAPGRTGRDWAPGARMLSLDLGGMSRPFHCHTCLALEPKLQLEHQCHMDGRWVPLPGAARHPQDHLYLTLCLLVLAEQLSRLLPGCPSVSGAAPSEPVVPRRSLLRLRAAVGVHWCA